MRGNKLMDEYDEDEKNREDSTDSKVRLWFFLKKLVRK